jgi:hypothetical protein
MNIFDSKEFQDNIIDQVNAMNKLQVEAFNAGYKQGLEDGKNAELDKQMKEQAGVETTESKVSAEELNTPQ